MNARSTPRSYCEDPKLFAYRAASWAKTGTATPRERASVRASQLQSRAMQVLREHAASRKLNLAGLGQLSGLGEDRVGRLLRGEIWMRLDDATALGDVVGVRLLAAADFADQGLATTWWPRSPEAGSPR